MPGHDGQPRREQPLVRAPFRQGREQGLELVRPASQLPATFGQAAGPLSMGQGFHLVEQFVRGEEFRLHNRLIMALGRQASACFSAPGPALFVVAAHAHLTSS